MSFREKVVQRTQERALNISDQEKGSTGEIELFEASPYFGIENVRNIPSSLELRLAEGISRAIPYTYVLEICFKPSEGIEIITTTRKIVVTGRNLKLLYNFLVAYRVRFIQANIGNDVAEERALFVNDISIEET